MNGDENRIIFFLPVRRRKRWKFGLFFLNMET